MDGPLVRAEIRLAFLSVQTFKVQTSSGVAQDYQYPCLLAETTREVEAGRELIWDYGEDYWGTLKLLQEEVEVGEAPSSVQLSQPASSAV